LTDQGHYLTLEEWERIFLQISMKELQKDAGLVFGRMGYIQQTDDFVFFAGTLKSVEFGPS
jgi:hypothetical protein